jgi:hypothetical protein
MSKIAQNSSTRGYTLRSRHQDRTSAVMTDKKTGKTVVLRGYGALKGEFAVRKGINIVKPIAAQAGKAKRRRRK